MGRLFSSNTQREIRQWTPEPVVPPFPGVDVFGRSSLNGRPEQALFLSTVWACVSLVANTIGVLPLQTYRRTASVPARISDSTLVASPSADQTQGEWLQMLLVSLLIWGNGYGLMTGRNSLSLPSGIELLDPALVSPQWDRATGRVRYLIGPERIDRTADIWHVRGMSLPGKPWGMSPVMYAADTIGLDQAARKFAMDFFTAGGLPVSALTSDMPINQEQATTLKQRFRAATSSREPITLGEGVKLEMHGVKPDESQFLETQQTNIARIAQFFGVPAEMVGGKSGSSLTYNTVEMNNQTFLDQAIRPWLRRIEDSFFALLPRPQFVQFDVSQLLRTDAESQAKVDAINIAAKIIAPSEIRTARGLPPMTEEQKVESSMVPATVNIGTGLAKSLPNPPAAAEPSANGQRALAAI